MSTAKNLNNVHPGEVLMEEFLVPLGITAYTALRLSRYFGTSPKFWLGLQDDYDLEEEERSKMDELNNIKHFREDAA